MKIYSFQWCIRLIGILILLYILYKIDLAKLLQLSREINFLWCFLSVILNFPLFATKSWRWQQLLKKQDIVIPFKESFTFSMASFYLGLITPGRSGEFIKILYLKEKNISISKGFSSVFVDKLFDLYVLLVLSLVGLWYFNLFGKLNNFAWFGIAIIIFIPLVFFHRPTIERFILFTFTIISRKFKNLDIYPSAQGYFEGINAFNLYSIFLALVSTFIAYAIFFSQCYFLLLAFNVVLPFYVLVLAIALSSIASLLPITFAGLGVREFVLIQLFTQQGLSSEGAVAYSFMLFINFILIWGAFGFVFWMIRPIKVFHASSIPHE